MNLKYLQRLLSLGVGSLCACVVCGCVGPAAGGAPHRARHHTLTFTLLFPQTATLSNGILGLIAVLLFGHIEIKIFSMQAQVLISYLIVYLIRDRG